MYYTYVLRSKKNDKLYIGFYEDLKWRKLEHDKGLIRATIERRPLELIYYEACRNKMDAIKREKQFKTGFGRVYLKRRLSELD